MGEKSQILPSKKPMPWNEWASVLELSCMWQMAKVRNLAIKAILEHRGSADDQKALLRLSTKLGITEIRDSAIQALSGALQPIERVQFGIECQVKEWLFEGYKQLVEGGISIDQEGRLGWKTTSKLFRIREQYLQAMKSYSYNANGIMRASSIAVHQIQQVFAEELKDAVWVGK
jgi:hypothetical protein